MPTPGHTRSSHQRDHLLQTPDTFVRAALPGMKQAMAIVHAAPARGARFAEYTVELEKKGAFETTDSQTFLYLIEGAIRVGSEALSAHQYLYLPPHNKKAVTAVRPSRVVVIEKPFDPLGAEFPAPFRGDEPSVRSTALRTASGEDERVEVRTLVPDQLIYDFAVNTMTFAPGAQLPMVEIHVMEHGLLMLEGEGVYRLGDHWYNVTAGDFIWMAPYCPQWFGALGNKPSKYLIYKDWNRHPFAVQA